MKEQLPEYTYTKNEKTFIDIIFGFIRHIFELIFPFFRIKPFSLLLDKLFASKFAETLLGAYALALLG